MLALKSRISSGLHPAQFARFRTCPPCPNFIGSSLSPEPLSPIPITHKKNPRAHALGPRISFLIPQLNAKPPHPRGTKQVNRSESRSSGFRISLLAALSHPHGQLLYCGFRPRLRRRVRDGISPSSRLRPKGHFQNSNTALCLAEVK